MNEISILKWILKKSFPNEVKKNSLFTNSIYSFPKIHFKEKVKRKLFEKRNQKFIFQKIGLKKFEKFSKI